MRSARRSGLFFASHDPQPSPINSITPTKTHAAGQSSLPAGTNSNTAKAAVQARLCNSHFATIRGPPFQGTPNDRVTVRQLAAGRESRSDQLVDPRSLSGRQRGRGRWLGCAGVVWIGVISHNGRNNRSRLRVVVTVEIVVRQRRGRRIDA